ncbi:MAG: TMEM165/GDT1 family protein [Cyanobacteria bacterium J06638_7]
MSSEENRQPRAEPQQVDQQHQVSGPTDPAASPRSGAAFLGALVTTFTTVFLAELGDKTQLAALLLSAQSGRPLVVFVGASLALVCSSLVGVLLGRWLARLVPAHELERLAGLLMVALSLWLGRQAVVQLTAPPPDLPLG